MPGEIRNETKSGIGSRNKRRFEVSSPLRLFLQSNKKNIKEGIIKDLKAENNNNQGVERRTERRTRKAREKVRYKSM